MKKMRVTVYDGEKALTFHRAWIDYAAFRMFPYEIRDKFADAVMFLAADIDIGSWRYREMNVQKEQYLLLCVLAYINDGRSVEEFLECEDDTEILNYLGMAPDYELRALEKCTDYYVLVSTLAVEDLKKINATLAGYIGRSYDLECVEERTMTPDELMSVPDRTFEAVIKRKDYKPTGLEELVAKWFESIEDTSYLIDCF